MRSVWIAISLVIGLLALAAHFRPRPEATNVPAPRPDFSSVGAKLAAGSDRRPDDAASEPPPLAATDLAHIMAVRTEIGSAAGELELGGNADFERELRELAGLGVDQRANAEGARGSDAGDPRAWTSRGQAILRRASADLEALALDAATAGAASGADELRRSAERIRNWARQEENPRQSAQSERRID